MNTVQLTAQMIELGAMLGALFLSALIFRKRVRMNWLLAAAGSILVGMAALNRGFGLIPEPAVFDALRHAWFNFALLGAVSLAMVLAIPDGLTRSGLTLRQSGPGVRAALGVSLAVSALITWMATQDVFGAPRLAAEPVAYNLFAIAPVEELFFRGVIFALVLEAFGARRVLLGAEVNWGLIPAALVFGFAHLTSTPGGEAIVLNYFQTLWTVLGGLVLAYLRQASGSLLMPYAVHAYGNCIHYVL